MRCAPRRRGNAGLGLFVAADGMDIALLVDRTAMGSWRGAALDACCRAACLGGRAQLQACAFTGTCTGMICVEPHGEGRRRNATDEWLACQGRARS